MKLKVEVDLRDRIMNASLNKSIRRILKGIEYDIKDGFRSGTVTNDIGERIGWFTLE